jgi:glycyl-tRNA synthetase beta subunit
MVRDCLKVLHRSGHLHNVFVLLAEGTYEYIEQYVKGNDKAVYSSISDRVDIKEFANVVQYQTSC